MRATLLLLCVWLVAYSPRAFSQTVSIEAEIEAIIAKHQAVGAAVVVVKDGEAIYARSFGVKDIAGQTPLGLTDLYRIASISKSFTATAFMQLVDQGQLTLQDDVSDLIGFRVRNPNFPEERITLAMLLSHTSSISDKNGYFDLSAIRPTEENEWPTSYNDYAPGEGYQYCNLNYNMAGAILERLTGKHFDDYIRENILQPLHINGGYRIDRLNREQFASLYAFENGDFVIQETAYHPRTQELASYVLGESTPVLSPTGGLKISAIDLARYMMVHMNHGEAFGVRLISEESSKKMQIPVLESARYGLGLLLNDQLVPGLTLTGHTGLAYGLYSNMFFEPDEKFGFIVITNGCLPAFEGGTLLFSKDMLTALHRHFIH